MEPALHSDTVEHARRIGAESAPTPPVVRRYRRVDLVSTIRRAALVSSRDRRGLCRLLRRVEVAELQQPAAYAAVRAGGIVGRGPARATATGGAARSPPVAHGRRAAGCAAQLYPPVDEPPGGCDQSAAEPSRDAERARLLHVRAAARAAVPRYRPQDRREWLHGCCHAHVAGCLGIRGDETGTRCREWSALSTGWRHQRIGAIHGTRRHALPAAADLAPRRNAAGVGGGLAYSGAMGRRTGTTGDRAVRAAAAATRCAGSEIKSAGSRFESTGSRVVFSASMFESTGSRFTFAGSTYSVQILVSLNRRWFHEKARCPASLGRRIRTA